ncbi:hypothetical protein Scep_014304 [Stephania cephalantha]|uniref:Uncharacterized protein n=1 Tax=Stephania cephalantha TaxID=152367 RepID=A0AAP0J125_9MAGN
MGNKADKLGQRILDDRWGSQGIWMMGKLPKHEVVELYICWEFNCFGYWLDVCSVVGSIMIVVGLYIYLWSKGKEEAFHAMNGCDDVDQRQITPLLV